MSEFKIITVYTGNRGFRKCVDTRKIIKKPVDRFKEILSDAILRAIK